MIVAGGFVAALGGLSLKIPRLKESFRNQGPDAFLGNFLTGFGGGLMVLSLRNLFMFLLAASYPVNNPGIELTMFEGFFVAGAVLVALGVATLKKQKLL